MSWDLDFYGRGLHVNRWPFEQVVANLNRIAALEPGRSPRVLEIGSGTGNNLRFVGEVGWFGVGVDSSALGLRIATEFLGGLGLPSRLVVASFDDLPFADASFDIVFDRGALIHATDRGLDRATAEVARVLADGGFFLTLGLRSRRHPDAPPGEGPAFVTKLGRPMSYVTRERVDVALSCFADARVRTRTLVRDDVLVDEEFEGIARKGLALPALKGWS
jgi:SAM-dependent methyltransferase